MCKVTKPALLVYTCSPSALRWWWHFVPGRPGIGGRTNRAARVSTHKYTYTHTQTHAHVRVDTHANTQTHKHTHADTHTSNIPCVLVVPCAACRPCHCHSSWSPPVVHVTAMCAALPCCHACSPSAPRWCCVGRAAWRCLQSLMMTQIDGWTRGVVKTMMKTRKGWPITPFRGSGNGTLADFWLLFLKLSSKLMN